MAQRRKRDYGSGSLYRRGKGWAIRWREFEIGPDGTRRRVQRYEALGPIAKSKATKILAERLASCADDHATRSRVRFDHLATKWLTDLLPMYRYSTQKNHRHILQKHLIPRFGSVELCDLQPADVQAYVADLCRAGYAPRTVDHIHDVLSAVLRTAVTWKYIAENPARGAKLPKLTSVRPTKPLTTEDAARLLGILPDLPKTLVGLALLTGLRRGELFGLRWGDIDLLAMCLTVEQAVYEGHFGPPKTRAGERTMPLSEPAKALIVAWRRCASRTEPDDLVFSTRTGRPIAPNNVLRRWVYPACDRLGVARASWLTFRRTYASWSHHVGVPGKVTAELMGHAKVDTTLNTYTQTMPEASRVAVNRIGEQLFTLEDKPGDRRVPMEG